MKRFLFIYCLLTFFACSDKKASTQEKKTDSTGAGGLEPPVAPSSDKPISEKDRPANAGTWHYEQKVDKEGRTLYKASITSPTLLEFDFPYNGGSIATLIIRKREEDTHVYIQVSKGQFNRSFQDGKAHIRFDGNSPVTYSVSAAENGSANVIFFDSEQSLINKMKAAQNMRIDVDFAGQDKRQIAFKIAGLKWNY